MNFQTGKAIAAGAVLWVMHMATAFGQGPPFVNFETAPVHPVALSADGKTLAVCNLPDASVEIFDLAGPLPVRTGAVFTGIDPVSARFNSDGELWVVNQISDSISIVDCQRLGTVATLDTFHAPADVVFTRNPARAYVSHHDNVVEVWDVKTRQSLSVLEIDGDRPRAMAVSADESEVYVTILESSNSSTIIAPPMVGLNRNPPHGANDLPDSPQGGTNPFPNFNDVFSPVINPEIPSTNAPPRVSLIVRKQNGRWMDDNKGDWTEYVSGTNAFLTGRAPGWDIADHDLAIINTRSNTVRYVRGLMNICFDVSVNPASGKVAVIGTDSINEVRFEPNLKSIFTRMRMALIDPETGNSTVLDLNPHLDYKTTFLPLPDRRESVGDPRGIAWNSRGTRAYVTGMGSNNLLVVDENGRRGASAVELPDGPTGVTFDTGRNRIYVFCRFASQLVTLDADSMATLSTIAIHDPTPTTVRAGRKHFYNTMESSGLGQVSCASCHVDGRFDRLAWDLGDQTGDMLSVTNRNFIVPPNVLKNFHPMKGPMVTQTLQDIIGHEPFHWRGDREGIEQFAPTFKKLQGREEELSADEMKEFKDFLATITFPPNRFRNLDNSLPTAINTGETALGRGIRTTGQPLPIGNAQRGLVLYRGTTAQSCIPCHALPTGLGADARFLSGRWQNIPLGTNGEHHVGMVATRRTSEFPFKIQQLRNLQDKIGFNLRGPISRAGFGFFHDGRVDSLTSFLQDGFDFTNDQDTADMIAFLLAFTGSGLPPGSPTDVGRAPGLPSRDAPAALGFQATVTNNLPNERTAFMMTSARSTTGRVDLVVHGRQDAKQRSWLMRGTQFISDNSETNSTSQLLALATPSNPLVFTLVPLGSGSRLALDRDADGFFNQIETDFGSDPNDAAVTPETTTPRLAMFKIDGAQARVEWFGRIGSTYRVQSRSAFSNESAWEDRSDPITIVINPAAWLEATEPAAQARFYRIVYIP